MKYMMTVTQRKGGKSQNDTVETEVKEITRKIRNQMSIRQGSTALISERKFFILSIPENQKSIIVWLKKPEKARKTKLWG